MLRGFSFNPGARDVLEHLMLRSGELVRYRGSKAASSDAETHSGVWVPRARRRFARGGVKPSSEA
jgi:hypothetical protein